MTPIPSLQPLLSAYGISPAEKMAPAARPETLAPASASSDSFSSVLGKMVAEVNGKQIAATDAVNQLQAGGNASLHQAVIAMEEANVSFQLMVEVRNKLLDSYQELMRMQV
ncbi:MAG TPA: flagellar hook-basal body complex protein FliE [Verrucomicrobiae bacterium]|nr:flagellar hook-basal body complex protein FliE [Verrucomicrobiae bacterium]